MYNNPRAQERDNQNSLRKFPFSDRAECGNGTVVLMPGAIIDMQLYIPARGINPVWMSAIDAAGYLHFSDEDGEFAKTSAPATPMSAVPVTFTGEGGPLPGGVVVFGGESAVSALLSAGGQEFTVDQTELTPAALTWLGTMGVVGFKLDDGNVVTGDVKFRGKNGCDVATFIKDGVNYLRISAVGKVEESVEVTGFITKVVATSNNLNFVVGNDDNSDKVINILATGVSSVLDNDLNADQENTCAAVKKARGTLPSASATVSPDCGADICESVTTTHKITFMANGVKVGEQTLIDGTSLGSVVPPTPPTTDKRFSGYFDAERGAIGVTIQLYYRASGAGVGRFTAGKDVTLYAHWVDAESSAEVTFEDYGTLHLAAPDATNYSNPIRISGCERPVPTVTEIPDSVLTDGGAEALSEIVLHPEVPDGEVTLELRGLDKAFSS